MRLAEMLVLSALYRPWYLRGGMKIHPYVNYRIIADLGEAGPCGHDLLAALQGKNVPRSMDIHAQTAI